MPKDQQIDIIDEIYDLRPAQPTIDDWHIRKVSGKVPQPDTGASDEYYTPRAKAASRDLVVRTPPSRSPTIGRGTDGACINNGRTVPGEKGNDSTGACDGQSEPDDAPKRPAKPILLPH